MAYAKRTCHKCGMIKPVNYMKQTTIKVKSGSSSEKLTAGTMVGFLLENPSSKKRVQKRIFANNKRGYVRNKDVWICKSGQCHRTVKQIDSQPNQTQNVDNVEVSGIDIIIGLCITIFALLTAASFLSWLF